MTRQPAQERTAKKNGSAWIVRVVLITFFLAFGMSAVAEYIEEAVPIWAAVFVLLFFIGLGILFDIVGIAIASAEETPFIAMSAKKVRGASLSLRLLKRADRMSNFCNDVVGDVCGIVSGAMGAYIALWLSRMVAKDAALLIAILVSSVIASLTVGGKALGKKVALARRREIVHAAGRALSFFMKRDQT
ncbi:MAG: hypothetical protein ACOX7W_03605 [Christensenellales bacterium]